MLVSRGVLVLLGVLVICRPLAADDFRGWQGIRVIEQDGRPNVLYAADINSDGREELIVVNSRYSRLDIYWWLSKDERTAVEESEEDSPNDLPMAQDFKREEIQLEHLPQDVVVRDIDKDGKPELVILVSPPNRVVIYGRDDAGAWVQQRGFDLLQGEVKPRRKPLLIREPTEGQFELLIGFSDGVQQLKLKPDGRADWLTPRERRERANWWLADLDSDGDEDLVEQSRDAKEAIRWYMCSERGHLMPAQVLFDRAVKGAAVLRNGGKAQLLLLDGAAKGLLRRYELDMGQSNPIGRLQALALAGGRKAAWCGIRLGDQRALVIADPDRPRLLSYVLRDEGWGEQRSYPAVGNIRSLASSPSEPGTLLIWVKDAADLQTSHWETGRLTYPKPWPLSPEVEDRKILALQSVGSITWWVQRVGKDLHLYRWAVGQAEPSLTQFKGKGAKVDQVAWLTGERLLVKLTHARSAKLIDNSSGKPVEKSPAHLKKARMSEFTLIPVGDEILVGRLTEGVLQWLDQDLQSVDQLMLPRGQELATYVPDDQASGWALQKDGQYIHRLERDSAGIAQVTESIKISGGLALVRDLVLGLMLVDHNRVTHLGEGQPKELKLVDIIDKRVGRSGGVKEMKFHRLGTTDIDGDGSDEVLVFDDVRHRISSLSHKGGTLEPQISWPVFEDKRYPYVAETEELTTEPRAVVGVDLDGDEYQDLAMLCHDRLILYLARVVSGE